MWNRLRRKILPVLHPKPRPLIRDKTDAESEFVVETEKSVAEIRRALGSAGFTSNPVSTLKYLTLDERVYESLSMAFYSERYTMQTHVYVFDIGNSRLVYAHREPSIFRPKAHQNGENQVDGDPENRIPHL
jgi:hypothetical protein